MIIQCEQCQTKFKLDDSKVADKSIKVRCARCRHVFYVAGMQGVLEASASFEQNAHVFQIEEDLGITTETARETSLSFEPDTQPEEDSSDQSSFLDSFSFAADATQAAPDTPPSANNDFSFSLPTVDGDIIPPKDEFGGLDFSGDDMFGDVVPTPPEEAASDSISIDVGMDAFADSMGIESSAASQSTSCAAQDQTAENPFTLDDIDFDDESTSVAVQQVSPEELKPNQDLLFAPLATSETKSVLGSAVDTPEKTAALPVQEELPPLSIPTRRKENPRLGGIFLFIGILIAGLAVFFINWVYVTPPEDKGKISQETGRVTVRSVEASFIKNQQTGDLLVISGEAVNGYNKPRAAIQIKGIVFGPDGKEVSSKSAFCGNPLSREQLATMTMDKIEAAMANQFGDSLANMEVAPGAAIPFVIVMPKPATGASDYGVEPAGSTVATGRQK